MASMGGCRHEKFMDESFQSTSLRLQIRMECCATLHLQTLANFGKYAQ